MKRLTRKLLPYAPFGWVGGVYFAETPTDKCPKTFCKNGAKCERNEDRSCPFLAALDRLAEYEDTGLMPDEIEKLKSPRWTPCAEGLPEADGTYDVTLNSEFGRYYIEQNARFENGEWLTESDTGNVIAWISCRKPYRADEATGKVKEDAE